MSYSVKIQLCDDDSVITEIEAEIADIEQGEKTIATLSTSLDDYFLEHGEPITKELDDTCEQCKKLGEMTCGNDMNMRCFEPIQ